MSDGKSGPGAAPIDAEDDSGKAQTGRDIIDATLRLAARNVSTSLRVADIIAEAQTSRAAFYQLFGSKAVLFAAVRRAGMRHMSKDLEARMNGDPLTKVVQWIEGLLLQANDDELSARHLPFVIDDFLLISQEGNTTGEKEATSGLRRVILEAAESGRIPVDTDVDAAARIIWFLALHAFYEHVALRSSIPHDRIRHSAAFALRGLGADTSQVEAALAAGLRG